MLGWQRESFKKSFKLDDTGISEYTMEQIKAKAATLGLTDSLTAQSVIMAKDADFTAKVSTGKLSFSKALKDNTIDIEELGDAIKKSHKITKDQIDFIE